MDIADLEPGFAGSDWFVAHCNDRLQVHLGWVGDQFGFNFNRRSNIPNHATAAACSGDSVSFLGKEFF